VSTTAPALQIVQPAEPLPRQTYTVAEVAQLSGISERTIRNRVTEGTFAVERLHGVGSRIVFPRPEIDRWLRLGQSQRDQHNQPSAMTSHWSRA
jgi:excisionase family DNA binding protein